MKWFISLFVLILTIELGAQTIAISIIDNPDIINLADVKEKIDSRGDVIDYQFVNINFQSLKTETSVTINFFDVDMVVYRDHLETRGLESFSWFGFSEDKVTTVIFTVSGNVVNGTLITEFSNYRLETLGGHYTMELLDLSKNPSVPCVTLPTDYNKSDLGIDNGYDFRNSINENQRDGEVLEEQQIQCKLRILVMYTARSLARDSNIENAIQNSMDELNLSFIYSNLPLRAELVLMVRTEYQEQGDVVPPGNPFQGSNDLNNFRNTNDGYMDNVHTLRDQYAADVCVLIFEHPHPGKEYSGLSYSNRASAPNAFCIVDYRSVGSGNFTFSHEIRHLFGARHDYHTHPNNDPYTYGHGHYIKDEVRTIMAYSREDEIAPQKLVWSGPYTVWSNVVLGNSYQDDNVRVLSENYQRMMYLSTSNQTLTVYNTDVSTSWAKTIYAGGDMLTNGNVIIQWGRDYVFRADKTIALNAGFEVQTGCQFEAHIAGCGQEDFDETDFKKEKEVNQIVDELTAKGIKVFPNLFTDKINISFENIDSKNYKAVLFDLTGKVVSVSNGVIESDKNYLAKINTQSIVSGAYLLKITILGIKPQSYKLIKP